MATVAVSQAAPAAMPAPTPTQQHRNKSDGTTKGIKRQRLRVNNKRVDNKDAVKDHIYQLIATKPRTPKDLQALMKYTNVTVWQYCKALAKEGKIEREGHYWKKKDASIQQINQAQVTELKKQDVAQLPILKSWIEFLEKSGKKKQRDLFAHFLSICTGKTVPTFKVNPENWQYENTTATFANAYTAHFAQNPEYLNSNGQVRIKHHTRLAVRKFISLCLKISIRENAFLDGLGLDGAKTNIGAHSTIMLDDDELDKALDFFANDLEMQALLGFNMEAIPRSERGLLIEINEVQFSEEKLEQAVLPNFPKPVRDPDQLQLLRALSLLLPPNTIKFETVKMQIVTLKHLETKTGDNWETYITLPRLVEAAKKWIELRRKEGHRYVFYNGKQDTNTSQEGKVLIELTKERGYYEKLRALYKHLGKTDAYFFDRPMYTLRHCGAQLMLRRTDWDYDYVAEHGWNDTTTLRTWYGRRGKMSLKDKLLHR